MDQQTKDWHAWRGKGIGASDAPIIMGVSPYKTPYQLWEQKLGLVEPSEGNWATRRGNEMEPIARNMYELETGMDMPAITAHHATYPFIRASLDGWNAENRIVLEIKCPGREDHETALAGKIPEKYWPQLQHQLFVTGAEEAHYYSYKDGKGVLVRVAPDHDYIEMMVRKEIEFWCEHVEKETPPALTARDFVTVRNAELTAAADEYCELQAQIKVLEEKASELKSKLTERTSHSRMIIGRVVVDRVVRKGAVEYSRIPELVGVDLEEYRKKSSFFYTVKESKK